MKMIFLRLKSFNHNIYHPILINNIYSLKIFSGKSLSITIIALSFLWIEVKAQMITEIANASLESQLIEAQKYELMGNPEKSIELLEKMRSIPETKASVYYQLARLYKSKSRLDDAASAIQESVAADPNNKWTRVFQANLFESVGRYSMSAISYEALMKIEPDNYTMYDLAALHYLKADNINKSLEVLDQAQNKFGPLPKIALQKSRLLFHQNKGKKAIELLLLSHKEYPKNSDLVAELVKNYLEQSNPEKAAEYTRLLQSLNPNHPMLSAKVSGDALVEKAAPTKINIDNVSDPDVIIKALIPELKNLNSGNSNQLVLISEKLSTKFPNDAKTHAFRADVLFGLERYMEASKSYLRAIEITTVPFTIWENFLVCLMKLTHWTSLEQKSNYALDYFPNQSFLYYTLALSQFNLKKYDDALVQIDQFALMSKNSVSRQQEANILKARILDETGKSDQSKVIWNIVTQVENADVAIIENCYSLAKRNKNYPNDQLDKAMKNADLSEDYLLSRKAGIQYYKKDYTNAIQSISQCLSKASGQNAENYELASMIYLAQGDKVNAKLMLSKAVEISDNPKNYNHQLNRLN